MALEYIVILVDEVLPYMRPIEGPTAKVTFHGAGTQMVGLRFRHTRPTHVINCISEEKKRELGDRYDYWYDHAVKPMLAYIPRKGGR